MSPRRRRVLRWAGGLGTIGVAGGYWQRRRIRRWGAIGDFDAAASMPVPTIDEATIVDDEHLTDAHARPMSLLAEAEESLEPNDYVLESARRRLDEQVHPGAVRPEGRYRPPAADAARLRALQHYRRQRSRIAERLAAVREETGRRDEDALEARYDAL